MSWGAETRCETPETCIFVWHKSLEQKSKLYGWGVVCLLWANRTSSESLLSSRKGTGREDPTGNSPWTVKSVIS